MVNRRARRHPERNRLPLFADDQAGYLVGYLSGLMEARPGSRLKRGGSSP